MTVFDKSTIGKLSAECPSCGHIDRLAKFATHYGDRSGLALVECKCGCGQRWRRIETLRGYFEE